MAGRVRLTPLGAMVLALLAERDMHPYEMLRLLRRRRDDRMVKITNGTFYHTVSRLEREELIAEAGVDRDGNRPERTTYTLLPHSHAALERWVRAGLTDSGRTAAFRVALAEAHNLPRGEVIALLNQRCDALRADREELRAALDAALADGVPAQFLIETDRHVAILDAELRWTGDFIDTLADPGFAWVGDERSSSARFPESGRHPDPAANAAQREAAPR